MVCLVRAAGQPILPALAARCLDSAWPGRIPHVLHRCGDDSQADRPSGAAFATGAEDVSKVRDILFALSRELVSGRNSRYGRIRFRRFVLLYWLMGQSLAAGVQDPDRVLREKLREHDITVRPDERILAAATDTVSEVVAIPAWGRRLLSVVPPIWFRIKTSGRLPGIGSVYRWFLRGQPNLAPQDPGTFIGFAERLTAENYVKEDPEQVMRLLMNAFLEDLRRAYGRWPWRLAGARRMTYAVMLLDGITRTNGGYRLLELINDIRNETGAFDPLLVISGSEKVPPYAVEPAGEDPEAAVWDAARAELGYQAWRNQFSRASRRRTPTAWYLPIRIPDPDPDPGALSGLADADAARHRDVEPSQELAAMADFTIDRPPWWSRRWVPGVTVIALLAALAFVGLDYRGQHCGEWPGTSGATWLTTTGGECIGISDGSHIFQPTNVRLAAVEQKVHEQNLRAVAMHQKSPARPYMTLVYLAAITSTANPPSELVTAREKLEGVAVVQARQLDSNATNEPIVRVLIANGGTGMGHGRETADAITRMAASDSSVVGVVGFDQSRKQTFDAIQAITRAGLPMVAATLSADRLTDASRLYSPLYYQVSPRDTRETEVAAAYADAELADRLPERTVRVLESADPTDFYSADLAVDTARDFKSAHFTVEPVKFNPQGKSFAEPSARSRAMEGCGYRGLIFFAGRQEDFEELMDGFFDRCRTKPPVVMGDDAVGQYVADRAKRDRYADIPFEYVSFAVRGSDCGHDAVHRYLGKLFPGECGKERDPSLDGAMDLAYDAAYAMVSAATNLQQGTPVPVTPAGLWRELGYLQIKDGQSGAVEFGAVRHFPVDKLISVVRVDNGQPKRRAVCGHGSGGPASWCPHDTT